MVSMTPPDFPCFPACLRCRETGACTSPPRAARTPRSAVASPRTPRTEDEASGEGTPYRYSREHVEITLACGHVVWALGAIIQLGRHSRFQCPEGCGFQDKRKVGKAVKVKKARKGKSEVDGQEEMVPF
jgi:hypothetical protein